MMEDFINSLYWTYTILVTFLCISLVGRINNLQMQVNALRQENVVLEERASWMNFVTRGAELFITGKKIMNERQAIITYQNQGRPNCNIL